MSEHETTALVTQPIISSRILNTEKTDYGVASLFMGEPLGLMDSLNIHYPQLYKLYKEMKSKDWDELEFKLGSSTLSTEFKTCSKDSYDIMIRTLAWQWEADTTAARSIVAAIAPFVTNSELFYGWQRIADNECLVEGTEVLTPNGWVDLSHVVPGILVAQYNPEAEQISFVHPIGYIEKDYEGPVFQFKNNQGHFNQIVTPNHRMLKKKLRSGELNVELAKDIDYTKGSASDLNSGICSGYIDSTFNTLTAFERILIAIQADGHISQRYTGELCGTVPVWFAFSKQRKIDRLISLCSDAGIELIELTPEKEDKGNRKAQRRFKINFPLSHACYLKNFNWVSLLDKGIVWCESFLEEIVEWDGHFTKNTGILHTTSRQAVEVTQAVAALCGMKTHLNMIADDRSETFSNCWRLSWKKQTFVSGQTIEKTELQYTGKVRCLTVPSGFFVIRYKDSVSITGNCVHALTYSEIVKNSFDNPNEVLADILKVKESFARLELVAEVFDNVIRIGAELTLKQRKKDQEAYDAIFMFVVTMYCLEAIQFMISFAITFAMGKSKQFVAAAIAIQKIAIDEFFVHKRWDREVLDIELSNEYGLMAFNRNRAKILTLINSVVESEMRWNAYTFSEGREQPGLTEDILNRGVLFYAKEVYEFFGFRPEEIPFALPTKNPLSYMDDWLEIDKMQISPMEQKSGNYVLGMIERDIADGQIIDIDLG